MTGLTAFSQNRLAYHPFASRMSSVRRAFIRRRGDWERLVRLFWKNPNIKKPSSILKKWRPQSKRSSLQMTKPWLPFQMSPTFSPFENQCCSLAGACKIWQRMSPSICLFSFFFFCGTSPTYVDSCITFCFRETFNCSLSQLYGYCNISWIFFQRAVRSWHEAHRQPKSA